MCLSPQTALFSCWSVCQLAALISPFVGKTIVHQTIPADERKKAYLSYGIPEDFSQFLVEIESKAEAGADARLVEREDVAVGKERVLDVLERRRDFWASASA